VPRIPEVHYPAPKPYSYEVEYPSLSYREVEHIPPPKYESPKLRDLAEIETFPEGYTNEYDEYQIENYFGSDGSDHAHYLYDNVDKINLDHGHFNPDPAAKVRPIQPPVDQYFVPVVNAAPLLANYEDPYGEAIDPITLETYTDKLGIQRYLYNDEIAEGEAYTPDNHYQSGYHDYSIEYDLHYVEPDMYYGEPEEEIYYEAPVEGVHYYKPSTEEIVYDAVKPTPEAYEEIHYYVVEDDYYPQETIVEPVPEPTEEAYSHHEEIYYTEEAVDHEEEADLHITEAEEEYYAYEEEEAHHDEQTIIHHEPK